MKIEKLEKHYNALLKSSNEDYRIKNLPFVQPFTDHIKEFKYRQILEILEYSEKKYKAIREIFLKDCKGLENEEEGAHWFDTWLEDYPEYQDIIRLYYKLLNAKWEHHYLQNQKAEVDFVDVFDKNKQDEHSKDKEIPPSEKKPTFKTEAIPQILYILQPYFPKQQDELKQVLETGDPPATKLRFNGSAKSLLDFFKQLLAGQFLIIPLRKDLECWISNVFCATNGSKTIFINKGYASRVISENTRAAKGKRLIDIKEIDGNLEIIQLQIKNRDQN
jgi:hypothetical protein